MKSHTRNYVNILFKRAYIHIGLSIVPLWISFTSYNVNGWDMTIYVAFISVNFGIDK